LSPPVNPGAPVARIIPQARSGQPASIPNQPAGRPPSGSPAGGWPEGDSGQFPWGQPQGFDTAPPPQQRKPDRGEGGADQVRQKPGIQPDPWATPSLAPGGAQPRFPAAFQPPRDEDSDTSTPVQAPGANEYDAPSPGKPVAGKRSPARPAADEGLHTRAIQPREVKRLTRAVFTLQFYNAELQRWSDLGEVRPEGQVFGRQALTDWDDDPESLADEHFRIAMVDDALLVEPLPSLNGVYLKLKPGRPAGLQTGTRFRVGHHVLAYRTGGVTRPMQPLRSDEGEVYQSRVLVPRGFVDLIGTDGEPYLCFPLTKMEAAGTRVGRGGSACDIALSEDDWVSSFHCRIYYTGKDCLLEDTGSTNGTFIEVREPALIHPGKISNNPLRPQVGAARTGDECDVILVGGYFLRVVDERP
jgi:pSer/pThr/pTyr-binding forkhead associated (FHA) protein